MMNSQSGSILITGAGQRLGFYNAKKLIQSGFQVIISYRSLRPGVEELRRLGARTIQADFATIKGISDFIAELKAQVSELRAIVHNASDWLDDASIEGQPEAIAGLVNVHMTAPYLINQACADLLTREGDGELRDIIHMSDQATLKGSAKHAFYLASKAALENLTLSFARKFAPGIKVNAIAPGLILFNDDDDDAYREKTLKKAAIPIEPGEEIVWKTLCFILENPYLTGEVIYLRGGRHLL